MSIENNSNEKLKRLLEFSDLCKTPSMLSVQLAFEEGIEFNVYKDTMGIDTIGIGHNLESGPLHGYGNPPVLTLQDCYDILQKDITEVKNNLSRSWRTYDKMPIGPRKDVITAMCFQLGITRFMQFVHMRSYIDVGYYDMAAIAMKESKWYHECPARVERLAKQLSENSYYLIPGVY